MMSGPEIRSRPSRSLKMTKQARCISGQETESLELRTYLENIYHNAENYTHKYTA